MLLTREEIKQQCRLEPECTDEDPLLDLIGQAVQARTETYLNRRLYRPEQPIPDDDTRGLHLTPDMKLGMLLLVTHYYEHRSAISEVEKSEMPMGFVWSLHPYRWIP